MHIQALTKMDIVVIKDFYHMARIDEDMNWMKLTLLLSIFPLIRRGPFGYLNFNS